MAHFHANVRKGIAKVLGLLVLLSSLQACQAPFLSQGETSGLSLRFSSLLPLSANQSSTGSGSSRVFLPEMAGQNLWITLTRNDTQEIIFKDSRVLSTDSNGWVVATLSLKVPKGVGIRLQAEVRNGLGQSIVQLDELIRPSESTSQISLSLTPTPNFPIDASLSPGNPLAGSISIVDGESIMAAVEIPQSQVGKGKPFLWDKSLALSTVTYQVQGQDGTFLNTIKLADNGGFWFNPPKAGTYWIVLHNPVRVGEPSGTQTLKQLGIHNLAYWLRINDTYLEGWASAFDATTPDFGPDSPLSQSNLPVTLYPVRKPIPATNLQGSWHLDGNANDSSGNGRNLSGTYTAVADRYGMAGSAQSGPAGLSTNAPGLLFNGANPFTISGWFRFDNKDLNHNAHPFWSSGAGANYGLFFSNGYISAQMTWPVVGGVSANYLLPTEDYGRWQHLAFVYTSSKNVSLYVNGTLQATSGTSYTGPIGTPDNFNLGFPSGAFDDLRIYNAALSATDISKLSKE